MIGISAITSAQALGGSVLGRTVRMDKACVCGNNVAVIAAGRGPHAAMLRCRGCDRCVQWLSHADYRSAFAVITEIEKYFGAPLTISFHLIKERTEQMATEQQYDNSGILFRNDDKANEKDRDYRGEAMIGGVNYWVSGWIKQGKKGKFLTFSFKPKDAPKTTPKKTFTEDFNDEICF